MPQPKQDALTFAKMAGAGNDFVVLDNRRRVIDDASAFTRAVTLHRISVGADGVILVEDSDKATFRMRYLNADGSETDFCANGTRCAARFAFLEGIAPESMTIEIPGAIIRATIKDGTAVRLELPPPRDFQEQRPLTVDGQTIEGSSIVVGVPHYVTFIGADLWSRNIDATGRAIRHHPEMQPAGANANFVHVRDRSHLEVRTWERGVEAETLACGSGVVASAVTSALRGLVDSPVSVLTRSGSSLRVSFQLGEGDVRDVSLEGDARVVYRGTMTPETISGFDEEFVRDPARAVARARG